MKQIIAGLIVVCFLASGCADATKTQKGAAWGAAAGTLAGAGIGAATGVKKAH